METRRGHGYACLGSCAAAQSTFERLLCAYRCVPQSPGCSPGSVCSTAFHHPLSAPACSVSSRPPGSQGAGQAVSVICTVKLGARSEKSNFELSSKLLIPDQMQTEPVCYPDVRPRCIHHGRSWSIDSCTSPGGNAWFVGSIPAYLGVWPHPVADR